MEGGEVKENGHKASRRSARLSSKTDSQRITRRLPIKRSRKTMENESRTINGFKEDQNHDRGDEDDGESPEKISKIEVGGNAGDNNQSGDGYNPDTEMEEESKQHDDALGEKQDQEMNSEDEEEENNKLTFQVSSRTEEKLLTSKHENDLENISKLGQHNFIGHETLKVNSKDFTTAKDQYLGPKPQENQQVSRRRIGNNIINRNVKVVKVTPRFESWHRSPPNQSPKIVSLPVQPSTIQLKYHKNIETTFQKPAYSQSKSLCRGRLWYTLKVLLGFLILLTFGVLIYQKVSPSALPQAYDVSDTAEKMDLELLELQARFPSQRAVFWKRISIYLKHHLKSVNPTEPASVLLTAGLQAERTLGCLARSLATVYSSLYNASIIEINGTNQRTLDSDAVKLEIDQALVKAFESGKLAAVIHHFEKFPSGSTLIFYRYCDHENAAYKNIFMVFSVMLSVDEIDSQASLSTVEDMVFDHIKETFTSSGKLTKFNEMDMDKLSGLWSRISHVILPVNAEEKMEVNGCEG